MVNNKRILVLGTSYGAGDVPPLLALVTGLVDRGNDVLFIGDGGLIDLTRGSGLSIQPVSSELDMLHYHSRWRQNVDASLKSPTPRMFSFDWGDAVFEKLGSEISDFGANAVICNTRTLYLGALACENFGAALCYLNVTCYFGPGSRRTLEQDYESKKPGPFVAGVLRFVVLFRRIDNVLSQDYFVQIVEEYSDGSSTVRELFLDDERDGQLLIEGFGSRLENAVIIVSPVTKDTYQSARYTLVVEDSTP